MTIAKKIGISVPSANKWLRLDEEAFENYLWNNTPYLEQYRAFIISILKICPQTPATNIMYRIKDQFPDFNCKKTTFFRYVKDLREQTGYIKPSERPTSFREETPPGYKAWLLRSIKLYRTVFRQKCPAGVKVSVPTAYF